MRIFSNERHLKGVGQVHHASGADILDRTSLVDTKKSTTKLKEIK